MLSPRIRLAVCLVWSRRFNWKKIEVRNCPRIFLEELRPVYCDLDKVSYLCLARKPTQCGRQCRLYVLCRRLCKLGYRVRKGNVGDGIVGLLALRVERKLRKLLAIDVILARTAYRTLNWNGYSKDPALMVKAAFGFWATSSGRTFVGHTTCVLYRNLWTSSTGRCLSGLFGCMGASSRVLLSPSSFTMMLLMLVGFGTRRRTLPWMTSRFV